MVPAFLLRTESPSFSLPYRSPEETAWVLPSPAVSSGDPGEGRFFSAFQAPAFRRLSFFADRPEAAGDAVRIRIFPGRTGLAAKEPVFSGSAGEGRSCRRAPSFGSGPWVSGAARFFSPTPEGNPSLLSCALFQGSPDPGSLFPQRIPSCQPSRNTPVPAQNRQKSGHRIRFPAGFLLIF